ncbi:MAG: hypothetical protein U0872_16185, partial [Planctomycetaceae bacterium]
MAHADELHRREFARQCLGGLGTAAFCSRSTAGDDPPPPPARPEDPPPSRPAPPSVELLLLSVLVERYPDERYTEEILRGIYRDIAADQIRGAVLREFPLK